MTVIIFHIDCNSAFLSWTAAYNVNVLGDTIDLREIPSVVGGNEDSRHGIVLAKSIPAKKYNIQTGEPLVAARNKCPNLIVVPPNYEMYVNCSRAFVDILKDFSPTVEPYSIDECYLDMSNTEKLFGSPLTAANLIKDRIQNDLGFTVNIGISSNKLLAKMAGDLKKPNMVHTLFPEEIKKKMWPLPVEDLFYVGRATTRKLHGIGIHTIGELANTPLSILKAIFKSHGELIYNFANGIDFSEIKKEAPANMGYGNSITVPYDVTTYEQGCMVLLSLCETVSTRLRADHVKISMLSLSITDYKFNHKSHQMQTIDETNITNELYMYSCQLFKEIWDHRTPLRQLGVHTSKVSKNEMQQYNLFNLHTFDKLNNLDRAIDAIRNRYGEDSIQRACFLKSQIHHLSGGIDPSKRTGITKSI